MPTYSSFFKTQKNSIFQFFKLKLIVLNLKSFKIIGMGVASSPNLKANIFEASRLVLNSKS